MYKCEHFYTNIGKFISSQTLSYKAPPKLTLLDTNTTEKNTTIEEHPPHKIISQSKNHFSALMEEDMVLDNTINQPSKKIREKNLKTNDLHNRDTLNGHVSPNMEDTPNYLQRNVPKYY